MITKPWLLPLFLGGALSAVYMLPKVGAVAQSAVNMTLPDASGEWSFDKQYATEAEIKTLKPDTEFSKATCFSPRLGETNRYGNPVADVVQLSIVLSGADINNSIHRPERCMPAQGHNITSSSGRTLKLPNGRQFPVTRLVSIQSVRNQANKEREEYLKFNCLTYYFFVGHDRVTNGHWARTMLDIKDRLVHGMDQRWAYASVSMWYGKVPYMEQQVSMAEADAKLQKFLTEFSEKQIAWDQITR